MLLLSVCINMLLYASLSLGVCCSCNAVFAINCTKNDHTSLIRRRYPHQFNGERVSIDNCLMLHCHRATLHCTMIKPTTRDKRWHLKFRTLRFLHKNGILPT